MSIYHLHHIVPKHAGGTDDPSNLIRVTIQDHAAFHYERWIYLGDEKDKLAWLSLSGQVGKEEIIAHRWRMAGLTRKRKLQEDASYRKDFIEIQRKGQEAIRIKCKNDQFFKEKMFEHLKNAQIKALSPEVKNKKKKTFERIKHQQGSKNSMYGTRWIHNLELKISKRISREEPLPKNWNEGRKINF